MVPLKAVSASFSRLIYAALLGLMLVVPTQSVRATHIVSGEVYWDCLPTGEFVFYLKFVRDCSLLVQPLPSNPQIQIIGWPTAADITNFPLTEISAIETTVPGCGFACGANPGVYGRIEHLLATAPVVLNGTPPPGGYQVVFSACCRTNIDNLVSPTNENIYFKTTMFNYNNQDMNPCYDSAPRFTERLDINVCSGSSLRYSQGLIEPDGDDVTYEFISVKGDLDVPLIYAAGYSPTVPLPGPTLDPNYDAVTLDPATGDIAYDANAAIQGRYVMAIKVTAYRCGQVISETIREIFTQITPCTGTNAAPVISPPVWAQPAGASGFDVTVQAGDPVSFTLSGIDADAGQVLTYTSNGIEYGTGFNTTSGCPYPPCATLAASTLPYVGPGPAGTTFDWLTDCSQLSNTGQCVSPSTTYSFTFNLRDDFCPSPATTSAAVRITIMGPPLVPSPQPHCASIDPSGDVTVSWAPSVDVGIPPSFSEYVVFHATNANGPFTQIGSVPGIASTSFIHSAGASPAPSTIVPNYYYISARSGCGGLILGPAIDTIATINLTVVNNGATAGLSWNAPLVPLLASSGSYEIWREYPLGTWTLAGTTTGLTYTDPVLVCNQEQVNYQIVLPDALPCSSISTIDGDIFVANDQPDLQVLDSVTVDMVTGNATLGWLPNGKVNVVSYNVETIAAAGGWISPFAPVLGYNNTYWENVTSLAQSQSECYRLIATNICGNFSPANGGTEHCTMLLHAVLDTCAREAKLDWNPYFQWADGVKHYEILASENNGPVVNIDSTVDSTYTHVGLQAQGNYCYYVRAVRNTPNRVTSTSNGVCMNVYVHDRPLYQYQYLSTVPDNGSVDVNWFVDNNAGYVRFDVLRGTDPLDLKKVGQEPFDPLTRLYSFNDNKARPGTTDYFYRVMGVDSCNLAADTMNVTHTVFLQAEGMPDRTNILNWNAYEGFAGGVAAYRIYRSNDGPYSYQNIVPPTTLTYFDDVDSIINGQGSFCYYVEALEAVPTTWGPIDDPVSFQEISRSNESCALQLPNVFTPTAFTPGGFNPIFRPVTHFVDATDYLFRVYNRWGMLVFETADVAQGWDGTMNGDECKEGVYAYHIRYVTSKGDPFISQGTVQLLRNR